MSEPAYEILSPEQVGELRDPKETFALDVLVGLSGKPKRLSSKYFYDDAGSDYFQQIMALDEYYATDCEFEILKKHAGAMVDAVGREPLRLIDLGAGDGAKTKVFLRELVERKIDFVYVPIDISEGAMQSLTEGIHNEFPGVAIEGLVCDYTDGLTWLSSRSGKRKNLLLFLGSNVGNFDAPHAHAFLRRLWISLNDGDYAMIGFDKKKDIDILLHAYNDSKGVTAKFNLNLLTRINRELGGNFDVDQFRHFGTYDVHTGAMTSYLVSLAEQTVWIEELSREFHFRPWEPIHTEYSYKYLDADIEALASATGYVIEERFLDSRGWFVDALWRVKKDKPPRR